MKSRYSSDANEQKELSNERFKTEQEADFFRSRW